MPRTTTRICPVCNQEKTLQEYRKRAKNRLEWTTKCSACRQRDKPPSKLPLKKLAKLVERGRMSDLELRLITDQRRARKEAKESYACRQRWERTWLAELNALMRPIKEELPRAKAALRYHGGRGAIAVAVFYEGYVGLLVRETALVYMKHTLKPCSHAQHHYTDLINPTAIPLTRAQWDKIPMHIREKLKLPLLIAERESGQLTTNLGETA